MKFLLIDDNPIDLMINQRLVEEVYQPCEIVKKQSGKEALEYLEETAVFPDFILLDIRMPLMDGFEFLELLAERKCVNPPTIYLVSSTIDPEDVQKANQNQLVEGFMEKPLSIQALDGISR